MPQLLILLWLKQITSLNLGQRDRELELSSWVEIFYFQGDGQRYVVDGKLGPSKLSVGSHKFKNASLSKLESCFFSPIYTVFQHACYYFKAMCLEVVISSTLSYECEWKGKSPVHLLICICLFMSSTVSGPLSVFSRVEWMAGKGISGPSESARASSQPKAKCLVLQ